MATTRTQLRTQAGEMLGVVQVGGSLRAEHDARLTKAYSQVYGELKQEGLNIFASTSDSIPDELIPHLAALLAFNVTDAFGTSAERYQRILARRNVAMPEIRKLTTPKHESFDDPVDY